MRYIHLYRHYYSIHANGWAASAGGFPAMTEHVAFLMKDIVLFSVSFYLLRQDVIRVLHATRQSNDTGAWAPSR
jgi:hypothetical protein